MSWTKTIDPQNVLIKTNSITHGPPFHSLWMRSPFRILRGQSRSNFLDFYKHYSLPPFEVGLTRL